jgi:hypothetical protein
MALGPGEGRFHLRCLQSSCLQILQVEKSELGKVKLAVDSPQFPESRLNNHLWPSTLSIMYPTVIQTMSFDSYMSQEIILNASHKRDVHQFSNNSGG